jgi:hypothetical protein
LQAACAGVASFRIRRSLNKLPKAFRLMQAFELKLLFGIPFVRRMGR